MKKIGIITILKVNNYGAELQAYATQKALQLMGYDAEIIDYPFYKNPRHIPTKKSKPVFAMPWKKTLAEWLYPRISRLRQIIQRNKSGVERAKHFEEFHKANTLFSCEYRTIDDLFDAEMNYDACVVGSDQVWNPGNYTSLDPYFLKFCRNARKLSYASSIGLGKLPEYTKSYYCEAWKSLDAISVREENAVEIVKSVSGCNATWVLDPTLLLDANDWAKVENPDNKVSALGCPYVLLYELTPCPYLKTLAKHVAALLQAKIVRITKDAVAIESDAEIINVTDAGPAEFLWLFRQSAFVVTNSFHGTAFSINLNKNFYVVTPARKKNNSRQQSILKLFHLSDRMLQEDAKLPEQDDLSIDFTQANEILVEQRYLSKNYLKNAIDEQ